MTHKKQTSGTGVFLCLLIAFGILFAGFTQCCKTQEEKSTVSEVYIFDDLLNAIEWVESKADPCAVGDNRAAVGAFQIHEIYVRDVNRILGRNLYTYKDRWDRDKSRAMTRIYLTYYENISAERYPYYSANNGWRNPYDKQTWQERMAALHCAGPDGYKQLNEKKVKAYWAKVKVRLGQK